MGLRAHSENEPVEPEPMGRPTDGDPAGDSHVRPRPNVDFRMIFDTHAAAVGRTLRYLGVPESDLMDAAQEVFLVVDRRFGEFEGRSSVSTWIRQICLRVALAYRRRRAQRREDLLEDPPEVVAEADQQTGVERREERALLTRLLDALDDDQQGGARPLRDRDVAHARGRRGGRMPAADRLFAAKGRAGAVARSDRSRRDAMKKDEGQPYGKPSMSALGPDPFGRLFEHARKDGFTRDETERLWRGVMAGSAASADPGRLNAGAHVPASASIGVGVKMAAVLLIGAGVAVTGVTLATRTTKQHDRNEARTAPTALASGVEAAPETSGPPVVSWEDLPRAGALGGESSFPRRHFRRRIDSPSSAEPSVRDPDAPSMADPVESEPPPPAGRRADPQTSEGALLLRARRQLASNPAAALELTGEDAERFPNGALSPEREVLAIDALVRLGRLPEARARLALLHVRYPQSPHLARLDALLHH